MDSYHRRALDIRGHWQVRFGLVWLAVCQPECPSHWAGALPVGLPGRGFKLKANPARQMQLLWHARAGVDAGAAGTQPCQLLKLTVTASGTLAGLLPATRT